MTDLMNLLILGVIQGLTEFLPISSSGHLVVGKHVLGLDSLNAEGPVLEVALHLGTLAAVLAYYRRDVARLVVAPFRNRDEEDVKYRSLLGWIVVGTVPTVALGFGFKDFFEEAFSNPLLVGFTLLVTGLLCLGTRFLPRGDGAAERTGFLRALTIGLAQGAAILPGISRSGSTIFAGMSLGLSAEQAGRFSFLLSLPAVAGAALLQFKDVLEQGTSDLPLGALALGAAAAAIVGFACLGVLTRLLRAGTFFFFGFYCIPLGLLVIIRFV